MLSLNALLALNNTVTLSYDLTSQTSSWKKLLSS